MSRKCHHPILEIEEFSSLGVHIRCLKCQKTAHVDQNDIEDKYLPFSYTASSFDTSADIHIYLRKDVLDKWPLS